MRIRVTDCIQFLDERGRTIDAPGMPNSNGAAYAAEVEWNRVIAARIKEFYRKRREGK